MNRMKEMYQKTVVPELKSKFGYTNLESVPRISKVVINIGAGDAHTNKGYLESILTDLSRITGQKAVSTEAKKAVASFKVRQGNVVGAMVTLRGERMYDFLDKLISITLPRLRDFRGLSRGSFDGRGNYSMGLKEHSVFIEIPYESITRVHGIQVTLSTTAKTNEEGMALLELLGFPFTKQPVTAGKGA